MDTEVEKTFKENLEATGMTSYLEKNLAIEKASAWDDNANGGHFSANRNSLSREQLDESLELLHCLPDNNTNDGSISAEENSASNAQLHTSAGLITTNDRSFSAERDLPIPDENTISSLNSKRAQNGSIKFCDKMCSRLAVEQCNRSCVTKYVGELVPIVFTKSELTTSSLTGMQSNANKDKNVPPPKKLNPDRVTAMRAHNENLWRQ